MPESTREQGPSPRKSNMPKAGPPGWDPSHHGDTGRHPPSNIPERPYNPPHEPLKIVAERDRWVAINKPSGLLSVPGRGEHKADCAVSRVLAHRHDATGPMTVHRLDLETSGILLVALDPRAQATLSRQFMKRKTRKRYLAVLDGRVGPDEGEIDLPIAVDWPNRPKKKIDYDEGKPSLTKYRVLERTESELGPRTRVKFVPITGRSHQLRIHAATPVEQGGMGCPIAGDSLYGDESSAPRLLLHAAHLTFYEPDTPERILLDCDPEF
ncbi:MAG: RluA family pseudouridine synthase [Planctomycetota bacterium]